MGCDGLHISLASPSGDPATPQGLPVGCVMVVPLAPHQPCWVGAIVLIDRAQWRIARMLDRCRAVLFKVRTPAEARARAMNRASRIAAVRATPAPLTRDRVAAGSTRPADVSREPSWSRPARAAITLGVVAAAVVLWAGDLLARRR